MLWEQGALRKKPWSTARKEGWVGGDTSHINKDHAGGKNKIALKDDDDDNDDDDDELKNVLFADWYPVLKLGSVIL